MQWSRSHVYSTFHICWGAQAGLYFHYGVGKYPLPSKMFGIFPHRIVHKNAILFRGFDDVFFAPHSRHTDVNRSQIVSNPKLKILAESAEAGVYAVMTDAGRQIFVTGHPEYDLHTPRSITATRSSDCRFRYRSIIFRMTTILCSRFVHGGARLICCFPIGSITLSIRRRLMISA